MTQQDWPEHRPYFDVGDNHTAICKVCALTVVYPTEELAQTAVVYHVWLAHREIYYAAVCVNGRHGTFCDGNHP